MSNSKQNIAQIEQVLYYSFGMPMPGRSYTSESYRFGFNGMEKDDELKGSGNSLDFGARIYDSRLGRWMATDILEAKYPWASPYNFVANKPIVFIDPDGRVIDWANGSLSNKQRESLLEVVNDLRTKSVMFDYIYDKLHSSTTVFTINYFFSTGTRKGYYKPSDNTININNKSSTSTISEEFFHAFQSLIYGNWKDEQNRIKKEGLDNLKNHGITPDWNSLVLNNKGTNIGFIESEAKLMKYLILYQAKESQNYINDLDKRSGASLGQIYIGNNQNDVINRKLKLGSSSLFNAQKTFYNWALNNLPATIGYTKSEGVFINSKPDALNDVIQHSPPFIDSPIPNDSNIPNNDLPQNPSG